MTSIEGVPVAGSSSPRPTGPEADRRKGVMTAVLTYTLWGFLPLFFIAIEHAEPTLVVAFRIICSLFFVAAILLIRGQIGEVRAALANRKAMATLTISALLISANWLIFIWAVTNQHVLDVSFGYFINPMVSVLIGLLLLGEKLSRGQWLAVGIAAIAIGIQAVGLGALPWIGLALALTFAFYGYARKTVSVGSSAGLMIETMILVPFGVGYIVYSAFSGTLTGLSDPQTLILLLLTGPATAIPLMLFAFAARLLPLSMIGMLQYIGPSISFALAIFLLGEPLELPRLLSFALIWVSLVIFSVSSFRGRKTAG